MQLEFNNITLDSKDIIEKYTKAFRNENAEFSFAHMFMWGNDGKMQYAQKDGCLFIKLDFEGEQPFLWPPFAINKDVDYKKALCTAFEYMISIGSKPILRSVSSPYKEMIEKSCPEIQLTEVRNNFDYVYLSEKLISLSGKKYHGKRNHINKLNSIHPDYVYEPISEKNSDECMELYDEWISNHDDVDNSIDKFDERTSVKLALTNMSALNLTGGCIKINGVIKAFTIGERILPDMHQIHIEKASMDIDGLYPLINQQYAANNCTGATYINREEDMGLDGLRKAKLSYRPARMVEKYNAVFNVNSSPCKSLDNTFVRSI